MRLFLYIAFCTPMLILLQSKVNNVFAIIASFFIPLLTGILLHTYYFKMLSGLKLTMHNKVVEDLKDELEEQISYESASDEEGDISFD